MIKFFHLICGTSILGLLIANFFYIAHNIQQGDRDLIKYAVKTSYFSDAAIFLCVLIQFITATRLVFETYLSLKVPWIWVAYHAFGLIVVLWSLNLGIKFFYISKQEGLPAKITTYLFYGLNSFIFFTYIIIIHDAVTQSTWFDFLLRK